MKTQQLHEDLAAGFAQRGLPLEYAERTAAELSDHHRDLVEELTTAGMDEQTALDEASSRLGDQKTLIKKSVREYQRRHWCGRWRVLTFLFGPVLLLFSMWWATLFLLAGIGMLREALGITPLPSLGTVNLEKYIICIVCKIWVVCLLPSAIVYFLAKFASRAALSRGWILLAGCVSAVVVGALKIGFNQAGDAFFADFPVLLLFRHSFFALLIWYVYDFSQVCHFLLPLIVAIVFLWKTQQRTHNNQNAVSS
jgi:hypothetical protein